MIRDMKRLIVFLFLILCSCSMPFGGSSFRVAIDPNWLMTSSGGKEALITGFIEELLLEISDYSGISFKLMEANWDNLLQNLHTKRCDAVISSLPPRNFNQAQYDFSKVILSTGPILVVPVSSKADSLEDLKNRTVGFLRGSPAILVLQNWPDIQIIPYKSLPLALNDVVQGKLQGALIDYLPAANFIHDAYYSRLKAVGKPLTDEGIRMVFSKGLHPVIQAKINKALKKIKKSSKYNELLVKWDLSSIRK